MCRPSCCDKKGGQGAGVATVAVVIAAALIVAKLGPIVAAIVHIVVEVLRVAALTTGMVLALVVITWAAIVIGRWQHQRKTLSDRTRLAASATIRPSVHQDSRRADCLACGNTGMVLRAISGGRYQPQDCPVCEPARRAG